MMTTVVVVIDFIHFASSGLSNFAQASFRLNLILNAFQHSGGNVFSQCLREDTLCSRE
jgi:uncharacterized membrane protein